MNTLLANATCPEIGWQPLIILSVVFVMLFFIIMTIVVWWRIFGKTGYSGALGLLMLVPVANLVMFLILAFSTWPIEKELKALKKSVNNE